MRASDGSGELNDEHVRRVERSNVEVVARISEQRLARERRDAGSARRESLGMPILQHGQPLMQPMYGTPFAHLPPRPPPPPQPVIMYAPPPILYAPPPPPQPLPPIAYFIYQQQRQHAHQLQQWRQQQHAQWLHIQQLQQQQQQQQQQLQQQRHQQQDQNLTVVDENVAGRQVEEKSREDETQSDDDDDVLALPGTSGDGARNGGVPERRESLDTGHPPLKRHKSREETEQATTTITRVPLEATETQPTRETQGTAQMDEQRGVEPVRSSTANIRLDDIEKLAATVQFALKEWIQKKGPDYECSFEDLSSDVQKSVKSVHRDDATCMHNFKVKVDICLNVMIGLGLFKRVGSEDVVVVSHIVSQVM